MTATSQTDCSRTCETIWHRGRCKWQLAAALLGTMLAASSLFADSGPTIIAQPESLKTSPGLEAAFTIEPEGTPPLYFQWRRNGLDIPGKTESTLTLDAVQADALGFYSVVVSNHVSSVTSDEVALSFEFVTAFSDDFENGNLDAWTVPAGAIPLTAATDLSGPSNGVFTAKVSSSHDKMYYAISNIDGRARFTFWMYDTNQARAYAEIRCFDGEPYGSTLVQLFAIGMYNSATMPGETHSASHFQGRVYSGTNAGWFSLNNPEMPKRSADWHRFDIERSADGTCVDFYVDGVLGRTICGVTLAAWDYVTFGSVVSGGVVPGNAWFDDVKVEFYDPPVFNLQPVSVAANSGDTIVLSSAASGDVQSYQWRFNGVAIPDATDLTLTLTNVSVGNAGVYTVVAVNRVGPTLSDAAVLSLSDFELPVITTHPTNLNVAVGSPATFQVTVTGAEPLFYTWFRITPTATNALVSGGNISGADTPTVNFSSVSEIDAATYRVAVSNAATTVFSSNAVLTVITAPVIVAQPKPMTLLAGQSGALSVVANGSGLTYQWLFENQVVPGATLPSLTLSNAQPNQAGKYSVTVSNSVGAVTSPPATVDVHFYLSALGSGGSVLKEPNQLSYAPGSTVTLTAVATPNYVFSNWSGDAGGAENPITISMNSHKQIWANFSNVVTNGKVIRDGNIDPYNLGKGDWIYFISAATNKLGGNVSSVTNEHSLMQWYNRHGIRYVIVKAGDNYSLFNGSYNRPQFTNTFVDIAHQYGILVFGYNRSYGANIEGEVAIANYVFNQGADGFVFDAEAEWEAGNPWITNAPLQAWQLCGTVRTNWPNKFIAYSPFAIVQIHDGPAFRFPYRQFGYWCDAAIPMIYHYNWAGRSPSGAINWTDVGWQNWQNACAHPTNNPAIFLESEVFWTNAIKPLAPVGHVYGPNPPNGSVSELEPEDVMEWVDYLAADPHCPTPGGYKGFSFWRADLHGAAQWTNIEAATGGDFPGIVNNIAIDDNQAIREGNWTHVRTFYNGVFYGSGTVGETNSFGTNYFTIGQGIGGSFAQFTPNISVAGNYDVYEWHVLRPDASASTPFQINFNGGSTIIRANQQTNSGNWSKLGRFNFATGTLNTIRITDDILEPDAVAILDGIKLVYVPQPNIIPESVALNPEGQIQFDISGVPGSVVEVQSRESLSIGDWELLGTITNVTGTAQFIDSNTTDSQQFYRLRLVP